MDKIVLINRLSDKLSESGLVAPKVANEIAESLIKYHPKLDKRYIPLRLDDIAQAIVDVRNEIVCEDDYGNELIGE